MSGTSTTRMPETGLSTACPRYPVPPATKTWCGIDPLASGNRRYPMLQSNTAFRRARGRRLLRRGAFV